MINRLTHKIFRSSASIFIIAAIVVILADGVKTGGFESKEYDIGLEAGLWLLGAISVEDIDVDKDGSLLLGHLRIHSLCRSLQLALTSIIPVFLFLTGDMMLMRIFMNSG